MGRLKLNFFMAVLMAVLLVSCSKSKKGDVEYVPFQETTDGKWGMISMDGKVLFKDEFKNKPTIVRDGRFFVQNKDGVWEMYDAVEKPQKIGGDYAHTSGFRNGRALVAEKGKPVSIIDKDANTLKVLDKIDGKEVDGVRSFQDDYAVFMTTDSLFGAIDKEGSCVVKPEYCLLYDCGDGKFLGVNAKYRKEFEKSETGKYKISVLDTGGKVLFEFSSDKYERTGYQYVEGKLAICVKKDGKETWGLIDDKGEEVVKPSSKIQDIGPICDGNFTYFNGEGWGLMNTKGETLIRAKYEFLYNDGPGLLLAVVKEGDSYLFKYVDEKDNQVGKDTYVNATLFSMYDGKHAWVKPNDKIFSIIDREGKQLEGLPDIVDISNIEGEGYIQSDYLDVDKLVNGFKINLNGLLGISYNSTPKELVKREVASGYSSGTKEHPAGSAYWYDYQDKVTFAENVAGVSGYVEVQFTGKLSRQTYRTERVIDYYWGDWYWYHDNKIPTGYVWNKVRPDSYMLTIGNFGKMQGKLRQLFNALVRKFNTMGTVAKQNNGAVVYLLKDGRRAIVYMEKKSVSVAWGNLNAVKDLDIEKFKDVSEEYDASNVNYDYLHYLFFPDNKKTDDSQAVADSTAVDSAYVAY